VGSIRTPGGFSRVRIEQLLAADWNNQGVTVTVPLTIGRRPTVKPAVWKAAGVADMGGCLCIGCLEKRIGRTLVPKDFNRNHPFHMLPGIERLLNRRDGAAPIGASRCMLTRSTARIRSTASSGSATEL
jgi:hypothetical protein